MRGPGALRAADVSNMPRPIGGETDATALMVGGNVGNRAAASLVMTNIALQYGVSCAAVGAPGAGCGCDLS